ncbi:uncharacterized protein [Spinacia oleracea]|uniref:Reverse transcriptase zinc-binding domain-containing protein n=1 Tax=Spinacia oleracea TaxID=3562 RepID=A0ABM3QQ33_SPIOL|nr:uncharacterized protein LOC130461402 [Spinacia oleracea]
MYQRLLGPFEKVRWRRLIWQNKASPKSLFITWVAIWGRLPTLDRLLRWKVVASNICPLCRNQSESVQHLFFECGYSAVIWSHVLRSLQFTRTVGKFDYEMTWMMKAAKRIGDRFKLLINYFAECIYGIWLQRNAKVFTGSCRSPHEMLKDIKFRVACRATDRQQQLLLD